MSSPVTVSSIFKPHYCSNTSPVSIKNTCACLKQAWMRGLVLDVLIGPLGWYGGCKAFTTQKNGSVILVLAGMFDNLSQTYLWTETSNKGLV